MVMLKSTSAVPMTPSRASDMHRTGHGVAFSFPLLTEACRAQYMRKSAHRINGEAAPQRITGAPPECCAARRWT